MLDPTIVSGGTEALKRREIYIIEENFNNVGYVPARGVAVEPSEAKAPSHPVRTRQNILR